MNQFKELAENAAGAVNAALGSLCFYEHQNGEVTKETFITVERNKAVKDDFGMLAGYRCEASILKSDICEINNEEVFVEIDTGNRWKVSQLVKETSAKWYVDIVELPKDGYL